MNGNLIGVIILDRTAPRAPGDIGNATTFPFSVAYVYVKGASVAAVLGGDRRMLQPFIDAARDLERQGIRAITTSCGFLALFQREMAQAVSVPVFTSSLMQVPLVAQLIGRERRIGIITANADRLTEEHFRSVGWSSRDYRIAVAGMEKSPPFAQPILEGQPSLDRAAVEREVVAQATALTRQNPDIGAFVMECVNLPPYSQAVRDACGVPVFDIVTLTDMVYRALCCGSAGGY